MSAEQINQVASWITLFITIIVPAAVITAIVQAARNPGGSRSRRYQTRVHDNTSSLVDDHDHDWSNPTDSGDSMRPWTNIDGTPMVGDTGVDATGNSYGAMDSSFHHDSSFD